MKHIEVLLEKKRYDNDYDSFGINEDVVEQIINEGNIPDIRLKPEDVQALSPEHADKKKKPVVALLMGRDGEKDFAVDEFYTASLLESGVDIRLVTYDMVEEQVKDIDGLVLPGGFFNSPPEWYHKEISHEINKRSKAYTSAIAEAFKQNIPLMGICAGMQMIGGMAGYEHGMRMHINLKEETGCSENHKGMKKVRDAHKVNIRKDSKLYECIGKECIDVNSNHGESVMLESIEGKNGPLRVAAVSPEGIVEAIEIKAYPTFAIGVQWHPEYFVDDENSRKLFNSFAKAARDFQKSKEIKKSRTITNLDANGIKDMRSRDK